MLSPLFQIFCKIYINRFIAKSYCSSKRNKETNIITCIACLFFQFSGCTNFSILSKTVPAACWNLKCLSFQCISILSDHHYSAIRPYRQNRRCSHPVRYEIPLLCIAIRKLHRVLVYIQYAPFVYKFSPQSLYSVYHITPPASIAANEYILRFLSVSTNSTPPCCCSRVVFCPSMEITLP